MNRLNDGIVITGGPGMSLWKEQETVFRAQVKLALRCYPTNGSEQGVCSYRLISAVSKASLTPTEPKACVCSVAQMFILRHY